MSAKRSFRPDWGATVSSSARTFRFLDPIRDDPTIPISKVEPADRPNGRQPGMNLPAERKGKPMIASKLFCTVALAFSALVYLPAESALGQTPSREPTTVEARPTTFSDPRDPLGRASFEEQKGVVDALGGTLDTFRELSKSPVVMRGAGGWLRGLTFQIPLEAATGDPVEDAYAFLERHASLLRLPTPRENLFVARIARSEVGTTVFFHQQFGGVSVYGADVALYLDRDLVTGLSGAWLSDAPPALEPEIDERQASEIAVEAAGKGASVVGRPRLMHYDAAMLGAADSSPQGDRLVWRVAAPAASGGAYVMVDAMTGAVLSTEPTMHDIDYTVQTANGSASELFCGVPGAQSWFDENGPLHNVAPDAEGHRANTALRDTYDLFSRLGRNAWDGTDGHMNLTLDRGLAWMPDGLPNAVYYRTCNDLHFSNETAYDDLVAHEFGHGVTAFSAQLLSGSARLPALQSASLNEHYSDVFAASIDVQDWTIGEGSALGVIRDMSNPPSAGSPGFAIPDRMTQLNTTSRAPHRNANIMNKAAYLIGNGGNFNGIAVTGIGRDKMARLYFTTLTTRLISTSNFQNAADATMAVVRGFADGGLFGFTPAHECSVGRAFTAIELDGDFDCDRTPDSADDDADFDGVPDATDNCPATRNPGQQNTDAATGDAMGDACDSDLDGDGSANNVDNCPFAANADQADWNRDGYGDACSDADFDRVVDSRDNCRFTSNPDQLDTDGDGVGNRCDVDADDDGFCYNAPQTIVGSFPPGWPTGGCPARSDNCPLVSNTNQADSDGDLRGDACDSCPMVADEGVDTDGDGVDNACDADDDGDGHDDGQDNCPLVANADQRDFNGNGVGAACDPSEQVSVNPNGGKYFYDGALRRYFDRYSIPLKCGDIAPPGFGGEELVSVGFDASAPLAAAVVNRFGERLATSPPTESGRMTFDIRGDFCPLPGMKEGTPLAEAGSEVYFLELYPIKETPRGMEIRIDTEMISEPPFGPR